MPLDKQMTWHLRLGTFLSLVVVVLAWVEIWGLKKQIRTLERDLAVSRGNERALRIELADMSATPLAYLILYRRATLARFERIEPRWDEIMESSWDAAKKHGVPAEITIAQIEQESGFNPSAVGMKGEIGLMQINPAAWPQFDPARGFDIRYNTDFGCMVFADCLKRAGGNVKDALRCYNGMGPLPEGAIPYEDRVLNGRSMKTRKKAGEK